MSYQNYMRKPQEATRSTKNLGLERRKPRFLISGSNSNKGESQIYCCFVCSLSKKEERWKNPRPKTRNPNPNPREENGKKKRTGRDKGKEKPSASLPSEKRRVLKAKDLRLRQVKGLRALLCAPTCKMADQPQHDDESQDNVGTGAEISTENNVPAISYDGSDGAPQSAPAVAALTDIMLDMALPPPPLSVVTPAAFPL